MLLATCLIVVATGTNRVYVVADLAPADLFAPPADNVLFGGLYPYAFMTYGLYVVAGRGPARIRVSADCEYRATLRRRSGR